MEKKKKFIIDVIFYSLIVLIIFGICKFILPSLMPFIFAFVIASILQVPVRKCSGDCKKRKKAFAILLCIAFYILLFSVVAVAGVKVFNSISVFLEAAPAIYQNEIVPWLEELSGNLELSEVLSDPVMVARINSVFQEYVNNIGNYITDFSMNAVKVISGGIAGIPEFIVKLVIMIVSSFFFVVDYDKVLELFVKCVPKGKEEVFKQVRSYVGNTIMVYLKSYSLLFLLTFTELSIGFAIMGIPYAPVVGICVAIFDILPILGTGGILLPWAVILFVMKNIPMAVGMIVLYLVITIIRNSLEPRLVGKQIGLHPLATLISMYLGLKLLGITGLILFPVTLAVWINMKQDTSIHFLK